MMITGRPLAVLCPALMGPSYTIRTIRVRGRSTISCVVQAKEAVQRASRVMTQHSAVQCSDDQSAEDPARANNASWGMPSAHT